MSRRTILALDPKHEVIVGWDPPMTTFFGIVYDRSRDEHDQIIEWVGAQQVSEVTDLPTFCRIMAPYADIGMSMQLLLHADAHNQPIGRLASVNTSQAVAFIAAYDRCIANDEVPPQSWLDTAVELLRALVAIDTAS